MKVPDPTMKMLNIIMFSDSSIANALKNTKKTVYAQYVESTFDLAFKPFNSA